MTEQQRDNPMKTKGFGFVEYASPDSKAMRVLFERLGFSAVARHRIKNITLFRQGEINFLLNEEASGPAADFAKVHGPSAWGMAFLVEDAAFAHNRALGLGAVTTVGDIDLLAIEGVGDSILYLMDHDVFEAQFDFFPGVNPYPVGHGLQVLDHLTHNVNQGRMDHWADFYMRLFNFHEQRYFNITGEKTGLISRALQSPCEKIRIPINESKDPHSQIEEYLREYKGEGIQHIALTSSDIVASVDAMVDQGISFLTVGENYYDNVNRRLPAHGLDIAALSRHHILVDGEITPDEKELLLQIFTTTVIGPIFFEIIQRMGHQGFGHGNFSALFESIEQDQMRRGVL